jgi:TctA family transporter
MIMKRISQKSQNVVFTLLCLLCTAPAWAATGAREDNSMVLVYLFLATCGLIILLQLIPVFSLLYGMLKGVFSKREEAETETVPVKHRS